MHELKTFISQKLINLFERNFQRVFLCTYTTSLANFSSLALSKQKRRCWAQTRTGIGLLGKPPAVKQFPPSKANRHTRLLRDPRANAGMKRTSGVEHNLYLAIVG